MSWRSIDHIGVVLISWLFTLLGADRESRPGRLPFSVPESTVNNDSPIVSEDTSKYFDHLRRRYGIKGLSVAVVASPKYTGEGWLKQTNSLGEANVHGNKVTNQTFFAIASSSRLFTSVATQILVANGTLLPNGKTLTLKTKIKDILGDEWVLKDKYAEERLDLINLLRTARREAAVGHNAKPTVITGNGMGMLVIGTMLGIGTMLDLRLISVLL